jgi:hypothetical protein
LVSHWPADRGCPDGKRPPETTYATIDEAGTKRGSATNPNPVEVVFCFALNMAVGSEYFKNHNGYFELVRPGDNAQNNPRLKDKPVFTVVRQVDNDQAAQCAPQEVRYSWPQPQRVVCLAERPPAP